MSTGHVLILGAIAGGTIFLGLPIGRLQNLRSEARAGLSALATGILLFLLWDVLSGAVEPIETKLTERHWGSFAGFSAVGLAGFALGLMGLVYYSEWMKRQSNRRATTLVGPGAAALDEFRRRGWVESMTDGQRLSLLIAVGIGVHNFGEGLAIGQAAATGAASLAVTLIVGFALHNATEGFGICGPMSGEGTRPTWGFLALLGVIGGAPTFLGTVVGQSFTNDAVSVAFLSLAAGSILYVVIQLVGVALRSGHKEMLYWGVFFGMLLGFATDFVVTAAGV